MDDARHSVADYSRGGSFTAYRWVSSLMVVVLKWREQEATLNVRRREVVPDFTNRAQTGLGVETLHFAARSMRDHGLFRRDLASRDTTLLLYGSCRRPQEEGFVSVGETCGMKVDLYSCAG